MNMILDQKDYDHDLMRNYEGSNLEKISTTSRDSEQRHTSNHILLGIWLLSRWVSGMHQHRMRY